MTIKYDDLVKIVYDELVLTTGCTAPFEVFKDIIGIVPKMLTEVAAQYWLLGISDESPNENVKMIAHQLRYIQKVGYLDVAIES